MEKYFCLFFFLTISFSLSSQEKKRVEALRIDHPITIDAKLDEAVYHLTNSAKDFVQIWPYNGKEAMQPSEVWLFYDQSAIYVGAMLYDSAPDSIYNFLTERDNTGDNDFFGLYLDPFNTGQIAFGFFVIPSGVQIDLKATQNNNGGDNEDSKWNGVWESKTAVTDKGWIVEMRIPYSELRFNNNSGNAWGLNIFRYIKRYASNNSWNLIDRKANGFINKEGQLTGIRDIKPPVRLSFTPYLATYFESDKNENDFLYKGGLDLKYGINESFTLDMMLIPDFGQIQSDDKKLNLSPFEIYYSEKRQFFTESTELFDRANIFYSRRIGASPKFSGSIDIGNNEKIKYNPGETQLVNATKVSGRNDKGWGLGLLNAMSLPSYAKIMNTLTGKTHKVMVQPFTNYNVAVVDKSLKNNSYISLINSNVSMYDNPFKANVTATEFQFRNKPMTYSLSGKGGFSARGADKLETGFYEFMALKKIKGDLQFGLEQSVYSDRYNPNDLGYLQNNNQIGVNPWIWAQKVEPFSIFREINGDVWYYYGRVYNPNVFYAYKTGYDFNATFKNYYIVNLNGGYQSDASDFFEPRVKGRFYIVHRNCWQNFNVNTDSRKPLSAYFYYGHNLSFNTDQYADNAEISATYRIGQHTKVSYDIYASNSANNVGFVDKNSANDSINFAKRDVKTISNILSVSYIINNKSGVTLRCRHYWSGAKNKKYYLLQKDGSLIDDKLYSDNMDQNYNAFTIDMDFRWEFSPGSELVFAWRNKAYTSVNIYNENYWDNLGDSWNSQRNSISLKVLYYIDYNRLKHKK